MQSPHPFSVVVCAYTEARWHELEDAIEALGRQTQLPHEILLIIDHNQLLYERAADCFPHVQVRRNQYARGLSGARNTGVSAATGAIVAFIDEDATAAPNWIEQLNEPFADPTVLGVGGAIDPVWAQGRPAWFPAEFDWVVGCTYRGMPQQDAVVRNLIGCNMAFRHEVFATVGGFRFGRVGALSIGRENDETEFCIRATRSLPNSQLLYRPSARVSHLVPAHRGSFRYFAKRCFSEGVSKARLRTLIEGESLSSERAYTLRILPRGVLLGALDSLFLRDKAGTLRAAAIILGLAVTVAGYGLGSVQVVGKNQLRRSPTRQG